VIIPILRSLKIHYPGKKPQNLWLEGKLGIFVWKDKNNWLTLKED
jgi:hypothetical protein